MKLTHRSLRWCRLIEIPNQQVAPPPPAGPSSDEAHSSPPPLFLYVQCWQRSSSHDNNHHDKEEPGHGVKQQPLSVKAEVSTEGGAAVTSSNGGADGATVEGGGSFVSLGDYSLTVHLYHPNFGAVWRTDVGSLGELRPSYMSNDAAFLAVFESIFRSTSAAPRPGEDVRPSTTFTVFPAHLSAVSPIVRVDVRMSARGGHASVAICAFHCSKVNSNTELSLAEASSASDDSSYAVSNLWALISRDVDRLSALQTASDAALAAAAATERRMVELAKQHQKDCDTLLCGFVEVLNQKKKKIRELTSEGDLLRRRMATLEEAFGSGEGSDVEELQQPPRPAHTVNSGLVAREEDNFDDDVQWIDPTTTTERGHLLAGRDQHVVAESSRKRSRSCSNTSREDIQPSKSRGELSANSLDHLLDM